MLGFTVGATCMFIVTVIVAVGEAIEQERYSVAEV